MNEALRVQAVKQFEKLDLEYNQELQRTIAFAAKICKTPVSSITLIDNDTQWIKVNIGLDISQTTRQESICRYTIKRKNLLVINDTHNDARFINHPWVTDGLKVRFYAGAPLITHDGYCIGTLCVVDYKPHVFTKQQQLTFKILAKHAITVMELKLSLDQLANTFTELKQEREHKINTEIKLRSMFESLTDAYFLMDKNCDVIDFNRAAYTFVQDKMGDKLSYGRNFIDFLTPAYKTTFKNNFKKALKGEKSQLERLADYGHRGQVWWDCVFEPIRNENREVIGVSYVARNINERKLHEGKIIEQNRLLSRIAEIQSHDYRGPVTSILGLMNLIEANNYEASKEYLMMLQTAVKKLDEKIYEVVNLVNDPKLI